MKYLRENADLEVGDFYTNNEPISIIYPKNTIFQFIGYGDSDFGRPLFRVAPSYKDDDLISIDIAQLNET